MDIIEEQKQQWSEGECRDPNTEKEVGDKDVIVPKFTFKIKKV